MRNHMAGARTSCIAVLVALAACVTAPIRDRSPMLADAVLAAGGGASRALYIGRPELTKSGQEMLQDVVLYLRPDWLRWAPSSRGVSGLARASVYTDGTYSGEVDVLRTIPSEVVLDVRYLPPVEARNRLGSSCHCAGGVILVRTRG